MAGMTRRGFLKAALSAGGAAAVPYVVPSSVLGGAAGPAPSERVTLGVIGCGGMGDQHCRNFAALADAEVLAGCDVRPHRRELAASRLRPGGKVYTDFRELLARDDIDAAVVATPHHTHAWIAVMAAKTGKDVYCEKPLTHTIHEGRTLVDAVRRYDRVLQVGTQRRAHPGHRLACELVRNERIGRLHTIRTRLHPGLSFVPSHSFPADPVPEGFDWDLWLGPAPWVPFSRRLGYWNRYSDYSAGQVTLMDSHILDVVVWGAEPFLRGPVRVQPDRTPPAELDYRVTFTYANGVKLICQAPRKLHGTGIWFEGTKGRLFVDVYGFTHQSHPASLLRSRILPDEVHLHRAKDNWIDFIQAVRTRGETLCPVGTGHQMTALCHLIWIAVFLRRPLTWDPAGERFENDSEADRLLHYAYREPWRL